MSEPLPISDQFLPLLNDVCDGELAETQIDELADVLDSDAVARKVFIDHILLQTDIRFLGRSEKLCSVGLAGIRAILPPSPPVSSGFPAPPVFATTFPGTAGYFSSGWPVAYLVAAVICGLGLLIGAFVHVSEPVQVAQQAGPSLSPLAPVPSARMQFVGRITGMVDCQWADPHTEAFNGASVPLGRKYALSSGLMEITYDSGAKVILQGPVAYEVESPAGGYLSQGKLTAKVESRESRVESNQTLTKSQAAAHSPLSTLHSPLFAVRTPTAVVTDLGTEFGVEVDRQGATTSYVFRGVVEVQPIARDGKRGQAVRLTEHESAVVEKDEDSEGLTIRRAEADPAAFVRSEQLPKLAEEPRLKSFRRWQAYSEELRKDPSLLAYYDFQQMPGKPAVLSNVAANGDRSLDGVVENATWTTGRMAGKHALLFNGMTDCVKIDLPQKTNDLTLAAWVCINSIDSDPVVLLASAGWGQLGQLHWLLRPNGCIACDVFGLEGRNQLHIRSAPLLNPDGFRRWMHLAIVHDRAAECARFYVNGRLMESTGVKSGVTDTMQKPALEQVPICIGPACIGLWDQGNWQSEVGSRNFTGRIDELAVFGRALTPGELQRAFELGSPTGSENAGGTRANR